MKDDMENQADDGQFAGGRPLRRTIERPTEPRLPLMDVSALPQEQRELAAIGASPNVLRMLGHRADLLAPWLGIGMPLTAKGLLPMRIRELLVLRVALRCSSEYEWANHVIAALSADITPAEIASLAQGTGFWSNAEAAGLALVEDLCVDDCASEQTWKALRASYDEGQIIELLLLIGFYRMNAGFLNSLGVPAEPGRPRFGQKISYEAPVLPQRPVGLGEAGALSEAKPDGTWQLKLYHPAVTQEYRGVFETKEEELSGLLTNEAAGFTVPLSEGSVLSALPGPGDAWTPGSVLPERDGSLRLSIELWPTAYHFQRGERLRVQVSSGAHPRFMRNLGSGEPLATGTKLVVADQTVYHDPEHPSAILLPALVARSRAMKGSTL